MCVSKPLSNSGPHGIDVREFPKSKFSFESVLAHLRRFLVIHNSVPESYPQLVQSIVFFTHSKVRRYLLALTLPHSSTVNELSAQISIESHTYKNHTKNMYSILYPHYNDLYAHTSATQKHLWDVLSYLLRKPKHFLNSEINRY